MFFSLFTIAIVGNFFLFYFVGTLQSFIPRHVVLNDAVCNFNYSGLHITTLLFSCWFRGMNPHGQVHCQLLSVTIHLLDIKTSKLSEPQIVGPGRRFSSGMFIKLTVRVDTFI